MRVLVTGCAGFIGFKVSEALTKNGDDVVGVDNLNHAYDRRLKEWRLEHLQQDPDFRFHQLDITNRKALDDLFCRNGFEAVINLAARAGVRYSVLNPWCYY